MLLVIDSATAALSVALIHDDQQTEERHEIVGRGHAEKLVPVIQELLAGRRPTEILVDCGPGSFTGVRVGLAAAHGLAIGWRIPLSGYSSLALIAAGSGAAALAVALHGGHGGIFVQTYGDDPILPTSDLLSLRPEDAARAVSLPLVLGSGAESLVAARGFGTAVDAFPRAALAGLLPPPLRALPPRPIYGRAPDARPMA